MARVVLSGVRSSVITNRALRAVYIYVPVEVKRILEKAGLDPFTDRVVAEWVELRLSRGEASVVLWLRRAG